MALITAADTLIIALATASKQIKVVRATIQWGLPQTDKQGPHATMALNPMLREKRIAVTSWFHHGSSQSLLDNSMVQLSHMEVLPPTLEGHPSTANKALSPPVLLTVRSHTAAEHSPYNQDQQSIVDRWEIPSEQQQSLHPAFDQLGSRTSQGSALPASFSSLPHAYPGTLIPILRPCFACANSTLL
jgi:mediator of RNA polymerase II transcription subunit 16